jgi:hypothetical protein
MILAIDTMKIATGKKYIAYTLFSAYYRFFSLVDAY